MLELSLESGTKVAIDSLMYTVIEGHRLDRARLRSDETGQEYCIDLLNKIRSGELVCALSKEGKSSSAIISLDDKRFYAALAKYQAIKPILDASRHERTAAIGKAAAEMNVDCRTIRNWLKVTIEQGFKGLIRPDSFGGKGRTRTSVESETLLSQVITKELHNTRTKKYRIYESYLNLSHTEGIKPLSQNTVLRRINQHLAKLDQDKLRKEQRNRNSFAERAGGFTDNDYPLQTIQIDHHLCDIILLDDETSEPVGRPWLTAGIDCCTRTLWGYYLGLQHPNHDTVGLAIINGVFNKEKTIRQFNLKEWPVYGIPSQIHTDNGDDFRAKAIDRGCLSNGIDIIRRPVKTPEYGAYIERFFGTLETQFIHELPGTTYSSVKEKGDYNSQKNAALTIEQFEILLLEYVTEKYHNAVHSGLTVSPLQKWSDAKVGRSEEGIPIDPFEPSDPVRFRQDFLPFVNGKAGTRVIESDGYVHFASGTYYASELNSIRGRNPTDKEYPVRYDPTDVRQISLYDEFEDRFIQLQRSEYPLNPISLRDIQSAHRYLGRGESDARVMEYIRKTKEKIATLSETSKKARRVRASARRESETRNRLGLLSTESTKQKMGGYSGTKEAETETESEGEVDIEEFSAKSISSLNDEIGR